MARGDNINFQLRGFALADVMIAITLVGVLVMVLGVFVREAMLFSGFVSHHQELRRETFAIANEILPEIIREASAIDFERSGEGSLSLYMDKYELAENRVEVVWERGEGEENSQILVKRGEDKYYLNGPNTYITSFAVELPDNPKLVEGLRRQESRAFQPMVRFKIAARYRRADGARNRESFTFFEDPRVSYVAAYTLRNYSFSNLR